MNYYFADFTDDNYRLLLRKALSSWRFVSYREYLVAPDSPVCLWRHDVDLSPQRALSMAKAENEEGARAHYFVHLNSEFYNALTASTVKCMREIAKLGHVIGLHFDPSPYMASDPHPDWDVVLKHQATILETALNTKMDSVSLHIPELCPQLLLDANELAGMINASSPRFREKFTYCSDSNGYWRFQRLEELLDSETRNIHVLTHPGLWAPHPMSPRDRVQRCIDGRAKNTALFYDQLLGNMGRKNVGTEQDN